MAKAVIDVNKLSSVLAVKEPSKKKEAPKPKVEEIVKKEEPKDTKKSVTFVKNLKFNEEIKLKNKEVITFSSPSFKVEDEELIKEIRKVADQYGIVEA